MPKDSWKLLKGKNSTTSLKVKKQMIIEWVWNKKGFAVPKTETKSTSIIKNKKVNEKSKRRKR